MNKKYLLVILAIVFFLWWTNKAKAQKTAPVIIPAPEPDTTADYIFDYWKVEVSSGDTFYKICDRYWETHLNRFPVEKTRDNILKWTKQNAVANGFKLDLYDDKPTRDLLDPDTLKPGQKLVLYTWTSFNVNNPKGVIMPGQQVNAFNTWDLLIDTIPNDPTYRTS